MPSRVTNCPNCGGQVEFKAGSSLLSVCQYCSSAVARVGDDITELEILGKVAPLADLGSPLSLGVDGKYRKKSFTLVGRVQNNYGEGPWNEWYAAFDDGRWGWLAEAQGRVYITFKKEVPGLPSFSQAQVGARFAAGGMEFVVAERRSAKYIAAEGELPFTVAPGETFNYADVQGANGVFGTIDYGTGEAPEALFIGEELTYDQLFSKSVLRNYEPTEAAAGVSMNCPNCASPVELKAPDEAQRVTCPACDSLLDCTKGSELYLLSAAKRAGPDPLIPLSAEGKLKDQKYTVYGHLVRSVTYDGVRYMWEEYLLHAKNIGYRWLICSDNHWSFVEPVSAGDIKEIGRLAKYKNQTFKHFQSSGARVESLRGEFYWKVAVGDQAGNVDYINPPHVLSREKASGEINWSLGEYMDKAELEQGFKLKKPLPKPIGIAPNMPNVHKKPMRTMAMLGGAFSGAMVVAMLIMAAASDNKQVVSQEFDLVDKTAAPVVSSNPTAPKTPKKSTKPTRLAAEVLSKEFELKDTTNLKVKVTSDVGYSSWLYMRCTLLNKNTNVNRRFGVTVNTKKGKRTRTSFSTSARAREVFIGSLAPGKYVLKMNPEWKRATREPKKVLVEANADVFVGSHGFWFFMFLWLMPAIQGLRYFAFEKKRWADSDH